MRLQFVNEKYGCVSKVGLTKYNLLDIFNDLQTFPESLRLYDDSYEDLSINDVVFVNDIVHDDWLHEYQLQLYKELFEIMKSDGVSSEQDQLDVGLDSLSDELLMQDLPVEFERDLSVNLNLLKYLKLKLIPVNDINELFEQLCRIHQFVCSDKLLLVNNLASYTSDFETFNRIARRYNIHVVSLCS